MIDMFTNYKNISDYYIPNNLNASSSKPCSYTKLNTCEESKPYELYNAKGELEGYYWYYGESINLEFDIIGEIKVENDAIIYSTYGTKPTDTTEGTIGQKAYNVADLKSWYCKNILDNLYIWEEDEEFTYPEYGSSIYLDASDYIKNKLAKISIYNFRKEEVYSITLPAKAKINILIDKTLSKSLVKGVYSCSLSVFDDQLCDYVFSPDDCILLVK